MNDAVSATAAMAPVRLAPSVSVSLNVPLQAEAPQALALLPPGQSVQAVVATHADKGVLQLKSDFGTFMIRLAVPLPEGTVLTLQTANSELMRLLLVDGKPVQQALPSIVGENSGKATGAGIGSADASKNIPSAGREGVIMADASKNGLTATVLRTEGSGGFQPGLQIGSLLTVRLAAVLPPPMAVSQSVPSSTTGVGLPTVPILTSNAANIAGVASLPTAQLSTGGANPLLAGGGAAPITVPPSTPLSAVAGAAPALPVSSPATTALSSQMPSLSVPATGALLTGTVVTISPSGTSHIQTPLGLLSLNTTSPLALGAQVQLEMVGQPQPPPVASQLSAASPLPGWKGLADTFNVLRASDPDAAKLLLALLPSAGSDKLGAALLTMMSSFRSGTAEALIGPSLMQRIERLPGGERLERSLRKDASDMKDALRQPAGPKGEWRLLSFPMNGGHTIEPIRLYVRPPPPEETDEDQDKKRKHSIGTRFVLEVVLNRIGPMQLDGLLHKQQKRFDLMVRTQRPLGADIQTGINEIFARSCREMGMNGASRFQVTSAFFTPRFEGAGYVDHGIFA